MVRRSSLRTWSGREAPSEGPGVVRRSFRRAGSGREAFPEGRKRSGDHHGELTGLLGGPGVVGRPARRVEKTSRRAWRPSWRVDRPSRIAGSGREARTKGRKDLSEGLEV